MCACRAPPEPNATSAVSKGTAPTKMGFKPDASAPTRSATVSGAELFASLNADAKAPFSQFLEETQDG